ncbi:MurR/RpiR family transcriptional regulator [Vagococcus fluvialis]|uniref:MurR/RpiR family transcriptional regulator n=1 Tax=Vagococcus fluvialis TaxID=2738 RepID=UPI003D101CE4
MLEKINISNNVSPTEQVIQTYIFKNINIVGELSAKGIAKEIPCSPATITRFLQKCGFSTYHDFQIYIKNEASKLEGQDITDATPLEQIFAHQIFDSNIKEQTEKLKNIIETSSFILCLGMGASGIMAHYAARKFNTIGFRALYSNEPYSPFLLPQIKDQDSSILIFSNSGETPEILELVQILKSNNKKIISITNKSDNTLAKMSDLNISYYTESWRLSNRFDMSSQIPTVALIEYIAFYCYKKILPDS